MNSTCQHLFGANTFDIKAPRNTFQQQAKYRALLAHN
jgi:hypothetical protein